MPSTAELKRTGSSPAEGQFLREDQFHRITRIYTGADGEAMVIRPPPHTSARRPPGGFYAAIVAGSELSEE